MMIIIYIFYFINNSYNLFNKPAKPILFQRWVEQSLIHLQVCKLFLAEISNHLASYIMCNKNINLRAVCKHIRAFYF